jgi:hypothetical protein
LTLDQDGNLSGTPAAAGPFIFTVQAIDAEGVSGTGDYTLAIRPPIIVHPADPNLYGGVVGQLYSVTFQAQGGTSPYTFSKSAGSLPPGLRLTPEGSLTGSAIFPGTFNFTVRATDNTDAFGERQYTVTFTRSRTTRERR